MSNHIDKANEYAIEPLKLVMTLASGTLVLTITFLNQIVGCSTPEHYYLLKMGWASLLLSIFYAWLTLVTAALAMGDADESSFAFSQNTRIVEGRWKIFKWFSLTALAWFIPFLPSLEQNEALKLAASTQAHFLLGLFLVGVFAVVNF